jgi:hypothetical protein
VLSLQGLLKFSLPLTKCKGLCSKVNNVTYTAKITVNSFLISLSLVTRKGSHVSIVI